MTVHYLQIRVDVTGTNQKASTSLDRSHIADLEMCNTYQLSKAHIIQRLKQPEHNQHTSAPSPLCLYYSSHLVIFMGLQSI